MVGRPDRGVFRKTRAWHGAPSGLSVLLLASLAGALLLGAAPARASMADAHEAARSGDYRTAFIEWESLAEDGVPSAMYNLAQLYRRGLGVARDDAKAVEWYREAAERFHVPARYNLALMHEKGLGVPIDYPEARRWYRLAANDGYRPAQVNLAVMCAIGQGGRPDWPQAHMWYSLAAAQGDDDAARARDDLAARMSLPERARADAMLVAWREKWGKE